MAEFSATDRAHILERDGGCLGYRIGMPGKCQGPIEVDHIENGGMGLKGPATPENGASLCAFHHKLKTEHAKTYRPVLKRMVAQLEALVAEGRWPIVEGVEHSPEYREVMSGYGGMACRG